MATSRIDEITSLINKQVEFQEKIKEHLLKAEAIANVALSDDFLNYKQSVIHAYLWTLCDMVSKSKNLHEKAFNDLLKNRKQIGSYNDEYRAN
jgi:hypothetical protein